VVCREDTAAIGPYGTVRRQRAGTMPGVTLPAAAGRPQVEMTTRTQEVASSSPPVRPRWQTRHRAGVVVWATLLCVLNALKPVTVDDAAYVHYARQIAEHPLDPYGFTILWYQHPQPAHTLLAPPVFCYWLSVAVRWFRPEPWVWKLWLWPWCLLLTVSMQSLLLRFA